MGRELKPEELVFESLIQEIRVLIFHDYYEDDEGNWFDGYNLSSYHKNKDIEHIDCIFESGGADEYLYMRYIFKYKNKIYSIVKNENSYGDSGFETKTLKEVFPKEVTKIIYE